MIDIRYYYLAEKRKTMPPEKTEIDDTIPVVTKGLHRVSDGMWASVSYATNRPSISWQKNREGPITEARTTVDGIVVRLEDYQRGNETVLLVGNTVGESSVKTVRSDGFETTIGTPVRCIFYEGDESRLDLAYHIQMRMEPPDELVGAALATIQWNQRTRKGVGIPRDQWEAAIKNTEIDSSTTS